MLWFSRGKNVQSTAENNSYTFMHVGNILMHMRATTKPPTGTAVAWGNMDGLFERSDSQLETRKDDLELKIALSKKRFNEGKEIKVVVSLVNKTDENINIREMDSMWIFGNSTSASYGIQILVTSSETGSPLESTGLFSLPGFLDEGFPPPEFIQL